jgi:hypothetical protein
MGAGINLAGKMVAGSVQNGNKALVMPAGGQGLVKGQYVYLYTAIITSTITKQHPLLDISVKQAGDQRPTTHDKYLQALFDFKKVHKSM